MTSTDRARTSSGTFRHGPVIVGALAAAIVAMSLVGWVSQIGPGYGLVTKAAAVLAFALLINEVVAIARTGRHTTDPTTTDDDTEA